MCPLHPELPPTSVPTPSFQVVTEHQLWVPSSYMKLALVIYFTYGNVYVSMLFSQSIPWFQICVCVCVCVCVYFLFKPK